MENQEKLYTQAEVDEITDKVRQNQQSKIDKNYIIKSEYMDLEAKYNDLVKTHKSSSIKEAFVKSGGIENSFDDMLAVNPDLLNLNGDKLTESISKLKEQKPYFFANEQSNTIENNYQTPFNDKQLMKELLGKESKDRRIEGTIYKIEDYK